MDGEIWRQKSSEVFSRAVHTRYVKSKMYGV